MAVQETKTVIGIDIGSTNICMSVYIEGKFEFLLYDQNERKIASNIFVNEQEEIVVGKAAEISSSTMPERGIYDFRRFLGKNIDDPEIKKNLHTFPNLLKKSNEDHLMICLKEGDTVFEKTPEELYVILFQKLKDKFETQLNQNLNKSVITMPEYFTRTQKEILVRAVETVGFTVLEVVSEPLAIATSNHFNDDTCRNGTSMICDCGGGSFDVSIVVKDKDGVKIICSVNDARLGGRTFDTLIVDYVALSLTNNFQYNPKISRKKLSELYKICEEAKKQLSETDEILINIPNTIFNRSPNVQIPLTSAHFSTLSENLLETMSKQIDYCLKIVSFTKTDIDQVILSGGLSQLNMIQNEISSFFNENVLMTCILPEESAANGAALKAAFLSNDVRQKITNTDVLQFIRIQENRESLLFPGTEFVIDKNTDNESSWKFECQVAPNQSTLEVRFTFIRETEKANIFLLRVKEIDTLHGRKVTLSFDTPSDEGLNVVAREDTGAIVKEFPVIVYKTIEIWY